MAGIRHTSTGLTITEAQYTSVDGHYISQDTGFPGAPGERDWFYRSDLDRMYYYNGSSWIAM